MDRIKDFKNGLDMLPNFLRERYFNQDYTECEVGEGLAFDEAELYKRLLQYRISKYLKDKNGSCNVLESHAGKSVGTSIYLHNECDFVSCRKYERDIPILSDNSYDLIDIDPFGQPYEALELALPKLKDGGVLMVTNGEMMSVTRHMTKAQHLKTEYFGKTACRWVKEEYIPYMKDLTGLDCQFFYAFPTTVRIVLSNTFLPNKLFDGCPNWLWWFKKYARK